MLLVFSSHFIPQLLDTQRHLRFLLLGETAESAALVVPLGVLHVPQVFGVPALVTDQSLHVGLPGGVPVSLAALVVVGVILGLGHRLLILSPEMFNRKKKPM